MASFHDGFVVSEEKDGSIWMQMEECSVNCIEEGSKNSPCGTPAKIENMGENEVPSSD